MIRKHEPRIYTYRNAQGYLGQLTAAINTSTDGCMAKLDLTSARAIADILRQFIHHERILSDPEYKS